jgi:hypothetical protein
MDSHPPPTNPIAWQSLKTRSLLPLRHPPQPLLFPQLPSPLRARKFTEQYDLSTHIIPAAYPRTAPYLPPPPGPPAEASKAERQDLAARNGATLVEMEDWYVDGAYGIGNPVVMWNCMNRFVRKDIGDRGPVGLTLFCAHGNGFPKEVRTQTCISKKRHGELVYRHGSPHYSTCSRLHPRL